MFEKKLERKLKRFKQEAGRIDLRGKQEWS